MSLLRLWPVLAGVVLYFGTVATVGSRPSAAIIGAAGLPSEPAPKADRVIALLDGAYGQLAALGLRPVGAAVYRDTRGDTTHFFPDPISIPELGNPFAPDGEVLAALQPDLIVGTGSDLAMLQAVAPVVQTGGLRTIEQYRQNLALIGAMTGRSTEAAAAIQRFDRRLAAYKVVAGAPLDVLMVGTRDGKQIMIEVGSNCELIAQVFRCTQDQAPFGRNWIRTSMEAVVVRNPDVIVLSNWSSRTNADFLADLARTPLWAELKAVQTGRVVIIDDYRYPDGLSLVKAGKLLDLLVPRLRPDVLTGPLTDQQVASIPIP